MIPLSAQKGDCPLAPRHGQNTGAAVDADAEEAVETKVAGVIHKAAKRSRRNEVTFSMFLCGS